MKSVIIFSGYNTRSIIAFLRTLQMLECEFGIIADSTNDPIFMTTYAKHVTATRRIKELDIEEITDCIRMSQQCFQSAHSLIAPSSEYLNRFLLLNRQRFEAMKCTIPLVDRSLYDSISDKKPFGNLCNKHGLKTPSEVEQPTEDLLPIVAKPRKYKSVNGLAISPELIMNTEDLSLFTATKRHSDYYFQHFISGESFYLLYYFSRNGEVVCFSQKNLVQQANGKSIVAAESSHLHKDPIAERYKNFLQALQFTGLVMIEPRRADQEYYMIEANPRFWGPAQLFVDAGVNLFHYFLYDWGATDIAPEIEHRDTRVKYLWLGGFCQRGTPKSGSSDSLGDESTLREILIHFEEYVTADIYKRNDTLQIFRHELGIA